MVSWQELVVYLKSTYSAMEESPGRLVLMFNLPDTRSQIVYVICEASIDGEEWAHITSPCGRVGDVDLYSFLKKAGHSMCAAGAISGNMAVIRHSVHLPSLQIDNFRRPLVSVALSADLIERELIGTDEF